MASRGRSYSPTGGLASIAAGGGVVVGSPPRSVRLSSVNGTTVATSPPLAAAAVGGRLTTMRRGRDVVTTSPSKQSSSPQQPGMVRRRTTTGSNSSSATTNKRSSLLHDYTQSHATDVTSPLLLRRCTTGPGSSSTTAITDELPRRKYPKARPIPGADVLGLGDSSSDSDNDLDASGAAGTNNHHNHNHHNHESMDESTESQKSVEELIRFRVRNPNSLPPLVPHHPPVSHLVPTTSTSSATTTMMPSAKQLMMARNHKALHSIVEEDKLEPSSRHSSYQSFSSEASSVATWSSSGDRGGGGEKLEDARSNHSHNQNNNNNNNHNPTSDPNLLLDTTKATDISLVQEESVLVMEDTSMLPKNIPQVTPANNNNNNNLLEEEAEVEATTLSRTSTLSLDPSLVGTDNTAAGPSEATDTDGSPTRDNHKLSARESLAASRDDILNGRDEGRASLSPPLSPIPSHAGGASGTSSRNRITTPVSTHHHKDRLMRAVAKVVQDIPPHKSRRKSSGTHDHGTSTAAGPPTLKRRPTADSVLGTCTTTRVVPTITTSTTTTNTTTNTTASSASSMEGSGRSGRLGTVRRTRSDDRECTSPTNTNTNNNTSDANHMDTSMGESARRGPALRRTQSSDGAGGALARMRRAGRRSGAAGAAGTGTGDVAMEESSRRTVARTRSSDGAGFANSARGRALRRSAGGQPAAADDIKAEVKKHGLRRSQSAVGADKDPVAGSSSGGGGMDGSGRRSLSPSRRSVAAAKDSGFGANHPARFNSSRIKRWDKEEVREIGLSSSSFAGHELQKMLKSHSNGLYYS